MCWTVAEALPAAATNNPHAQDGYPDVEVLVEPQTVKEWMIDRVLAVEVGKKRGDRESVHLASRSTPELTFSLRLTALSGIVIALGVLGKTTEITKPSWIFDLTVLTDGPSPSLSFHGLVGFC